MPAPINVALPGREYDVRYSDSFADLTDVAREARAADFALIDANVDRFYGRDFRRSLPGVKFLRIAAGETSKSFISLERIANELVRGGATRQSRLFAIGGGVVGDLTGFLAGVFMRGIDFIQLPTTLLAMVDSSVGGKTAVNIKAGKNLVGVFHQPRAVIVMPRLLKTLPARELGCGLAESVKTALIADASLVHLLERQAYDHKTRDIAFLADLSAACIRIKADVVVKDEKEQSVRAFLNFGHTLAHAIEARTGYKSVLHGEAVAVGMRFAALLSRRLGHLSAEAELRIENLLKKYALPNSFADLKTAKKPGLWSNSALIKLMRADKKNQHGTIRFVTLAALGEARLPQPVSEQELLASLKEFQTLA